MDNSNITRLSESEQNSK